MMKTPKHGETGLRCTTYWERGETLFFLMRPEKRLTGDRKRPKFTHRVGSTADPNIEQLKATAREAFRPRVEAILSEMEGRASAAASRGEPTYQINFRQAKEDYVAQAKIKTIKDRESQLDRHVLPEIGNMICAGLTFRDVNSVLLRAAKTGLMKESVGHIRKSIMAVLKFVYFREQIADPDVTMKRVRLPDFDAAHECDKRPRMQVTDDELVKLVTFKEAPLELCTMAMVSRCLGGMRTSDLHSWDWLHINLETWGDCFVPRPKTEGNDPSERHEIPAVLVPFLKRWWMQCGRPSSGAVFGTQRARRAGTGKKGQAKGRGISYAQSLRHWLLEAGVRRHELHNDTIVSRKTDFHSFRRSYATALARTNTNAQSSMALTGHTDLETHLRYVRQGVPAKYPEAALPKM